MILTVINIILTVVSAVGAFKSIAYYKKSKKLEILTQSNKSLIEIQKMLKKLQDALSASNKASSVRKGFSLKNTLRDIGKELDNSLREIEFSIPTEYIYEFKKIQKDGSFDLHIYINSYISGEAIKEDVISSREYNLCQIRLIEIERWLKKVISDNEEKLK